MNDSAPNFIKEKTTGGRTVNVAPTPLEINEDLYVTLIHLTLQ